MNARSGGKFVLSLDFELHWGMPERDVADCAARLLGARQAVPRLLDLFADHGVSATWATVGFLFFDDKDELLDHLPDQLPNYASPSLSSYGILDHVGRSEQDDPYHFGLSLVKRIHEAPRQELASHTFSHYLCLEPGQTSAAFAADLAAAQRAASRLDVELKSLVFPRNQINPDYLALCRAAGITAVRGNPDSKLYHAANQQNNTPVKRIGRLSDAYLPITGPQNVKPRYLDEGLTDIPASTFLRPVSRFTRTLERLRLRRIRQSMTAAARSNSIFHLWFHPHNFGHDVDANLHFLGQILDHYRQLADSDGMRSVTMAEAASG